MFENMSEKHQRCRCIGLYPSLSFFGSPISREFDDYSRAYEFTASEAESFTNTFRPFFFEIRRNSILEYWQNGSLAGSGLS